MTKSENIIYAEFSGFKVMMTTVMDDLKCNGIKWLILELEVKCIISNSVLFITTDATIELWLELHFYLHNGIFT